MEYMGEDFEKNFKVKITGQPIIGLLISCFLLLGLSPVFSQEAKQESKSQKDYWEISNRNSIVWDLTQESRLPHHGNIEMAGKNVASIVYYELDEERNISITKDLIFPQLRIFNKNTEPDWKKYRAYFRRSVSDEVNPLFFHENKTLMPGPVDSIEIAGKLIIYHQPFSGLQLTRTIFPSMEDRVLVEKWEVKNIGQDSKDIQLSHNSIQQREIGYKGDYNLQVFSSGKNQAKLAPQEFFILPVYHGATLNEERTDKFDWRKAEEERNAFLAEIGEKLILQSPNEIINTLFYFSKIRAAESIYNSQMGLVHSPGGGNYYAGIWANDQIEYSGPFFPYLGYDIGNRAGYNAYKWFLKNKPIDFSNIPYAFEVDGIFPMKHLDRGDAAMIAYGTSKYLLALGDLEKAEELWPLIEWSLEYCHRKKNEFGAIASESDEMEGRIETGRANLSTSSLYFGGLKHSIHLAKELGFENLAEKYAARKMEIEKVIENYFGAEINGLKTYKYFDENKYLRHWICLPLSMGIFTRKEGTLEALFNHLWTENGILVELKGEVTKESMFWDRATLYALRGGLKAGETELTKDKLIAFSQKRLLGDHVPYVVEAYPENNMKHLSAESALYCRIYTEGMLGIEPQGFGTIKIRPNLPKDWDTLSLKKMAIFGQSTDIHLTRRANQLKLEIKANGKILFDDFIEENKPIIINYK